MIAAPAVFKTAVSVAITVPVIDMQDGKVGGIHLAARLWGIAWRLATPIACRPDITRHPDARGILTLD